jgi:membrane protein YqaA with SNARE-associated domain
MDASELIDWLRVWVVTCFVNVIPAFMPSTSLVLTYFHFHDDLAVLPLAAIGASAAGVGRTLLALGSRALGPQAVPPRWRTNVENLVAVLQSRKTLGLPALAMFTISPLPSNYLFIAAGIAGAPLRPIVGVFVIGRFFNYLLQVGAAEAAADSLGEVLGPGGGWTPVVSQLAGLAVLLVVMRIDWGRVLRRWAPANMPDPSLPVQSEAVGSRR